MLSLSDGSSCELSPFLTPPAAIQTVVKRSLNPVLIDCLDVSCCVGLQALGLEVRSVLAIGGIGGLAIGLAGREICENLLNGFLLMTTVRGSRQ